MSVKLIYQDVAPGAAQDAAVTAAGEHSYSNPSLLPFGVKYKSKYIAVEHNFWTLNGSGILLNHSDNTDDIAFWSNDLSDINGDFSVFPTLTIDFDERYTSLGISFEFLGDAWCNDLEIAWYRGGVEIESGRFYPDGMNYFCEASVEAYDRVVITIRRTSLPYRRARIDRILFGVSRTFLRDELRAGGAKVVQEIDPSGQQLAANALDFTLSSKSAVEYVFQFKQPVYAYDDDNLIGVFYIDDSERLSERMYDVSCTDAIGVLDLEPFPDAVYTNENAFTLAQAICSGFTVEMQDDLKTETVSGVIVGQTRRGALQQLCFRLGAIADTSGTSSIRIFTLDTAPLIEVDAERIRTGGKIAINPIVTEVRLMAHSYSLSGSSNEIEINGVKYYDTQTVVSILNPEATASDKANVINVTDATLISPDVVNTIAQKLFDYHAQRNVHKFKFHLYGELPGAYLHTVAPWTDITGHYVRGSITLSGFALSDAEVIGT